MRLSEFHGKSVPGWQEPESSSHGCSLWSWCVDSDYQDLGFECSFFFCSNPSEKLSVFLTDLPEALLSSDYRSHHG